MTPNPLYKITPSTDPSELNKKDFQSDQDIRWCPGCGDYSILKQVQSVLPGLGIPKEDMVVVSGIGCSSRFPYYMNTFGLHTIHGRAPGVVSGIKSLRPELSVWMITGDGDSLSIGGNHLIHILRRNMDVKILLFNNRIYGLTKGQYSPTSERGKRTKSTPLGSLEEPFNPISLALASGASFVARSVDVEAKHLQETLKAAAAHKGTALVEIFQNCNIFNDGAFKEVTHRQTKADQQLVLRAGEPAIFGANKDRGLVFDSLTMSFKIAEISEVGLESIYVHNPQNKIASQLLAELGIPDFPVPLGVLYQHERPCYDQMMSEQIDYAQRLFAGVTEDQPLPSRPSMQSLLDGGDTWLVQ